LFCFEPGATELSLAELTRRTELSHATARRLVLELVKAGALEQREDGRFCLGLRLWQLSTLTPRTESLRMTARPFPADLFTVLEQHVQLAVLDENEAVIIELRSAPRALRIVSKVGGRLPLHCSAVGKVLLSHASPELIEQVLNGQLRRYTPRTIVDPQVLRQEFAECRRTGSAMVRGEMSVGADSFASRIMDHEGHVVAALAVVVRADSVQPQSILPSLLTSGLGVSRRLGWQPGVKVKTS
jgi:DNA-binding IclR family transcriptional regulator